MVEEVYYCEQPEPILYMPLPDGGADVWIRKNIEAATDNDEWIWRADEVYLRTDMTLEKVTENFEDLFRALAEEVEKPAPEERITALENENKMLTDCILEMSAIIYE